MTPVSGKKLFGLASLAMLLLAGGCSEGDSAPPFDFYVLSLSWSPTYCTLEGNHAEAEQCDSEARRGFVVHGLWPQFERGYPEFCPLDGAPGRRDLEAALRVMPSESLARHQWRKHGSCTGLSPAEYFAATEAARARIRIPEAFGNLRSDRRMPPPAIERAFTEANPGLGEDAIAIACEKRMLREVRICMDPDLSFRPCPEVDRRGCRAGQLTIPAAD